MTEELSPPAGATARVLRAGAAWVERRPALASVALVAILLASTVALLHPAYQSADDTAMALYAAGVAIRDTPDAHLLFMNAWLGWLLKSLYTARPDLPWYALLLYAVLAFAHLVVLFALRSRRGTIGALALFLVLFAISLDLYSLELQFTIVAMYCTAAGWLAATALAIDGRPGRFGWLVVLLALLLGASVRSIGFALATLLCAPLVLHGWEASSRTGRRRLAAIVVTAGAGYVALQGLNTAYYRADPAWADFLEYNALRANFNDFQVIDYDARTRAAFDAVGWSKNDYLMIKSWFHADPVTFSAEKMRRIVAQTGTYGTDVWSQETARRIVRAFATTYWLGAAIVMGWIGVVWGWSRVWPVLATLAVAVALVAAVSVLIKPMPPRIALTMAGLSALSAGFLATPRRDRTARPHGRAVLAIAMTLVVAGYAAWCVSRDVARANVRERQQRAFEADIRDLAPRPSQLYVAWGEAFPIKYVDPLASFAFLRQMRILPLGAELGTPHVAGAMQRFGIDNIYLALAANPNLRLISDDKKNRLYVDYMREKYRLDVTVRPTFEGHAFSVYQVRAQ